MASDRIRQINELLRSELSLEFNRELELPEGSLVTITKINTAPDLHNATIFISITPIDKSGSILEAVRKQFPHIIQAIAPRLVIRTIPRFKIIIDEGERRAAHIDKLLDGLAETE